jgi:hypothetical protein
MKLSWQFPSLSYLTAADNQVLQTLARTFPSITSTEFDRIGPSPVNVIGRAGTHLRWRRCPGE